jgi:hypothetical protein
MIHRITHRELGLTATTFIVAGSETSEPLVPTPATQDMLKLQHRSRHDHLRSCLPPPLEPVSPREAHICNQERLQLDRKLVLHPATTARISQRRVERSSTSLPPSSRHAVQNNDRRTRNSRRPNSPTSHESNHEPVGRPSLAREFPPSVRVLARALAGQCPGRISQRRQSSVPAV